jgi:hypothetical protein
VRSELQYCYSTGPGLNNRIPNCGHLSLISYCGLYMQEQIQELLQYYVYLIRDPEGEKVFYVGKGVGGRANSHEKEAEKLDVRETRKIAKIREITDRGARPSVVVVGRYETEAEALAVEATLIKWVYGFDELTNAIHGHRHKSIRSKGFDGVIAGIDIPSPQRSLYDGTYTNEQREQIIANRIIEKLSWLKDELRNFNYSVSEPDITRPLDPCVWVCTPHDSVVAQIKVQLSGNAVVINFRPKSTDEKVRQAFQRVVQESGLKLKNGGEYAPAYDFRRRAGFPGGIALEQIDLIKEKLKSAIDRLEGPRSE